MKGYFQTTKRLIWYKEKNAKDYSTSFTQTIQDTN